MTLISTLPSRDGLTNNFVQFLKSNNNIVSGRGSKEEKKVKHHLTERLERFGVLAVADVQIIPADRIFLSDRYAIKLNLADEHANNFVLLRGMFEFSRPKAISFVGNAKDRTFQIEISESQRDYLISYLETILGWFIKEIQFKKTLSAIIKFEENVKRQQAILYGNAMSCFS